MQFTESSVIGLRAARHRLTSPLSATQVTLFPMIHIGEPAFFARIQTELSGHDMVLCEGVRGKTAERLTRAYKWAGVARLGLTLQPRLVGDQRPGLVHADLTEAKFDHIWRQARLTDRAAMAVGAAALGLWRRMTATRASLARDMGTDDLSCRDDLLMWDAETAPLIEALRHARDKRLCETLDRVLRTRPERLAVLYGAAHMPAAMRHLRDRHGFQPTDSKWLTVFAA